MKYILTKPIDTRRIKKSWWALFQLELEKIEEKDCGLYVFQEGSYWKSYNYIAFLRLVRSKYRTLRRVDPFPNVKSYQWHFKHHLDLLKRGVRKPSGRVQEY